MYNLHPRMKAIHVIMNVTNIRQSDFPVVEFLVPYWSKHSHEHNSLWYALTSIQYGWAFFIKISTSAPAVTFHLSVMKKVFCYEPVMGSRSFAFYSQVLKMHAYSLLPYLECLEYRKKVRLSN